MIIAIDRINARERAIILALWDSLTYTQKEEVKANWDAKLPAGWLGHTEIKVVDRQPTGDLVVTMPATR